MNKLTWGFGIGLVMLGATVARADGYGQAGCGLGSILFGTDDSKLMQILAATTNGTFGSQTFGITSGTSNCVSAGMVKAEKEQAAFAEVNFQDLKRNMASGGGEFLMSFASLLGCTDGAKPAFAKMTQNQYETIVPAANTTPVQLLSSVKKQIKGTPALAGSCSDERALARSRGKPISVAKR